jgi:hypothetical protein
MGKNKGKSLEKNVELWIFISLTSILVFSFSGVYKSAILIIPLFILMNSNKPIPNENLYILLITMIFLQVPIFRHMFNFDIYSDLSIWSFFSFAVSLILYSVIINNIVFKVGKNE